MSTSAKTTGLEVRGACSLRYELEPLIKEELETWDARIADYESVHLFHRRAWLDYLAESQGADIRHWAIREAGRTAGYLCAGVFNKGPFRILGSPLKSWGTNFLGPAVNSGFSAEAFLQSLDELAAREGLATLEIENPVLDAGLMASRGYEVRVDSTYIIELTPHNQDRVWERIDKKDH